LAILFSAVSRRSPVGASDAGGLPAQSVTGTSKENNGALAHRACSAGRGSAIMYDGHRAHQQIPNLSLLLGEKNQFSDWIDGSCRNEGDVKLNKKKQIRIHNSIR
jgi:hypothetical protein